MTQTYLFYDIETTGLNKAFDQILHFAAIRTDTELNELDRYDIKIKLNSDAVLSPYALKTHRIGIKEAQQGINEFDAMKQIHRCVNTPGTISLGYNSLGFDDEFLRFSFYRNLLPPYTHQYENQCGRMDLFPLAIPYFLFKNEIITWPKDNLKLENINKENQFHDGRSHHAMTDVEITLALARKFFAEREMWDYIKGFFNKETDQKRFKQWQQGSGEHSAALLISNEFYRENNYQTLAVLLGQHRHYKNQMIWLRLDKFKFDEKTTREDLWTTNKKWCEPPFVFPLKSRFQEKLSPLNLSIAENNLAWLQKHPDFLNEIKNYFCEYQYPVLPTTDVDASLYLNGFWTPQEKNICENFMTATPQEKSHMIENMNNPILKELATRVLGRHFPESLSFKQMNDFSNYLQRIHSSDETKIPHDFKGEKHLTPQKALIEIELIRGNETLDENQNILLDELEEYLRKL